MKRSALLIAPVLLFAACQDAPGPLGPPDDPHLSLGAGDGVDVIVVLEGAVSLGNGAHNRERAAEVARGLGLEPGHTYGTALFGFSATVPRSRVEEVRRSPMVARVELDRVVSLPEPVLEPLAGGSAAEAGGALATEVGQVIPWGIDRTGARANGSTGRGVHVYVLDTGIDASHPDLEGAVGAGHTVFTTSCRGNPKNCSPPPTWDDDNGHGTHVAGTIGARDNGSGVIGVAPEVTLHAVKVLSASGSGSWSGVIAGIDWVAGHNPDRPRVANMSLGGGGYTRIGSCTPEGPSSNADAVHQAICNAKNAGVVFVVSAGNGGDAARLQPAALYDASLAVSATSCAFDPDIPDQTCVTGTEGFTSWSSWGAADDPDWPSEGSLPVAIAAPGASVLSTQLGGGHVYKSGTSMAAPHVAGGAALVLQDRGASQAADGSAFTMVRAALLGATECTESWRNPSGNPHSERFLNLRSPAPIDACVEPAPPPPVPPVNLTAVSVMSSSVSLEWDHVDAENARFQVATDNGRVILAVLDGETAFTVEGLTPVSRYQFGVRTVNDIEASAWSNILTVTTPPEEIPDFTAEFFVDCGNDNTCWLVADHDLGYANYHWIVEDSPPQSGMGMPAIFRIFHEAKTYSIRLTITVGDEERSGSGTVTCVTRGRNLRCS